MRFKHRTHAAHLLLAALTAYQYKDVVVYALPRGGVVLGRVIADNLSAPLDVLIPRKIGHPYNPEYAIAAVTEHGAPVVNKEELSHVDPAWLKKAVTQARTEAKRRRVLYLNNTHPLPATGRICILVDDGLATGLTMKAAIQELITQEPEQIIVAVPVAPKATVADIKKLVDAIIVLYSPHAASFAIGNYYDRFEQVSDAEVLELLNQPAPANETQIEVGVDIGEIGLTDESAATYPAPDYKRIGVSTTHGTPPIETDQGDEEYEGRLYGSPDDLSQHYGEEQQEVYIDNKDY